MNRKEMLRKRRELDERKKIQEIRRQQEENARIVRKRRERQQEEEAKHIREANERTEKQWKEKKHAPEQKTIPIKHNTNKHKWYNGPLYKELKDWQKALAKGRRQRRKERKRIEVEERKKKIVEKYGTEPTICYFYYLWNAVDYVGEELVRKSFESIAGQGDEVIVSDYSSTDGTAEIAKEYGIRVLNVEKTPGIPFHMSKLINKILLKSKSTFIVDLSIHTTYPKDFDSFFKNWIKNNDITKKQCAVRGLFVEENGSVVRRHAAALLFYKPFLLEAGGYDERTYYGFGTTPYILDLMQNVWLLEYDDHPLEFVHRFHRHVKFPLIKKMLNSDKMFNLHRRSQDHGESLVDKLIYNFDEGVKKVENSYNKTKVFGIGLSRTGTVSLTEALKILGYEAIHAPRPFFCPELIEEMKHWEGATDSQISNAYKELDEAFPNCKFILTTRPLKSWLKSYETHLLNFKPRDPEQWEEFQTFFYGSVNFDKKKYRKVFIKHYWEVLEYFKDKDNFLILDLVNDDCWEKICHFLDKPIPNRPFPHINNGDVQVE